IRDRFDLSETGLTRSILRTAGSYRDLNHEQRKALPRPSTSATKSRMDAFGRAEAEKRGEPGRNSESRYRSIGDWRARLLRVGGHGLVDVFLDLVDPLLELGDALAQRP